MRTRLYTITHSTTLITEECCNCGILFAMPDDYRDQRVEDRQWFYCPNGHPQRYTGQNTEEKLRKARAQITHLRDQREAAERSAKAYKGHFTRVKGQVERAQKGVCPHCNRSFEDLRRHMASKHEGVQP